MVRPIILVIGVLSASAILGLLLLLSFTLHDAETLITTQLESISTKLLRTSVSVSETPISLKSGKTQVIGLKVQNPAGFSNGTAIHWPSVIVEVDTLNSTPRKIHISRIKIEHPAILLEIRNDQMNLSRLMQALRAAPTSDDINNASEMQIAVQEVLIENGELSVLVDELGEFPIKTPLPDSRIVDIGVSEEGVRPQVFLDSLTAFIIKATERATRRINVAKVASERNMQTPEIDFKSLLAE